MTDANVGSVVEESEVPPPVPPASQEPPTSPALPAADGSPASRKPPPPPPGRRRTRRGGGTTPEGRRRQLESLEKARAAQPGQRFFGKGVRKLDIVLKEHDVGPYEELMKRPDSTLDTLTTWLHARGYRIGRSSVRLHRVDFRGRLANCKLASEMAKAFNEEARRHGGTSAADATAHHAEQQMMQVLFKALDAERKLDFSPGRWREIHRTIGVMTANRVALEWVRNVGRPGGGSRPGVRPRLPGPGDPKPDYLPLVNRMRASVGLPPAERPPPRPG